MNPSMSSATLTPLAWWRVPHMWMVVGGPLMVVVASLVTAYIAVNYADPVIDKAVFESDRAAALALKGPARDQSQVTLQPAQQARNHAAAPVLVPKER
ncbi:nitrogen fixation protein FixH [Hydrogenophaga sp.]|uniref:nitrogen fixation protein FixH n=1 Tax=Hydrogenophaga sp. TaxID=1904254 RepID=UPI002721DC82|nr:nitrogen fixation protein FixH [Hydrogenophaga sp.]MDO9436627.1 nitrogen fixation protein FixH [Hydrogenophaga sp.]